MSGDSPRTAPSAQPSRQERGSSRPAGLGRPAPSLLDALTAGQRKAALSFAGQASDPIADLATRFQESPEVREFVRAADAALREEADRKAARWSGYYPEGFELLRWLEREDERPALERLIRSPQSMPLIFVSQVAELIAACREGLQDAFDAGAIVATTGHSQGLVSALLAAESGGEPTLDRAVQWVRYMFWQGHFMQRSHDEASRGATGAPMAAVSKLERPVLEAAIAQVDAGRGTRPPLTLALHNTRDRFVVSGPPAGLALLRQLLEARTAKQKEARKLGRHGGAIDDFTWEDLPVSAAFHSPLMAAGVAWQRAIVAELGLSVDPAALTCKVVSSADGTLLNDADDVVETLMKAQYVDPVRWSRTVAALSEHDADLVLDLGPGDGVAKLAMGNLRGRGVDVLPLTRSDSRRALFTRGEPRLPRALDYADFAPQLVRLPDGKLAVDNRYTRATGQSPVVLPGMTPTTVDCGIVAAAANAGYTAELAGGGQVSEAIFDERMTELAELLAPGTSVVFNALYLDRYLWDLHFARQGLVKKARRAGAPLCGVTVSAGVPETAEAVELLDELAELGLWLNAFKPGTVKQIDQVIGIAKAAPHQTIFMHLEGGRAGGHHSWEDLEALLLARYHRIRECGNLVLCVGGGIGTPERAAELLTGAWSLRHEAPAMPVDGVLLGTVTMAAKEATTSPQVKQALVDAKGSDAWVHRGTADGGVTSGLSQLDADIHYLDNPAARCGRLLDSVAGDAEAVAAKRGAIIEALNATAKPYFGDFEAMPWRAILERLVELMAIGRGGRYEDGIWPDVTYRQRFADVVRRAEARLAHGTVESVVAADTDLDDPKAVVARLVERYPEAATRRPHPADARWFVREVCARPGKPVCFVPVIDADVRRWYKSDSLWQAHDERYEADRVLVIPGPEAVAGIDRADEPIAELLGRFEQATVEALQGAGAKTREAAYRAQPASALPLPNGYARSESDKGVVLEAARPEAPHGWLDYVHSRFDGPVAALLGAREVHRGTAAQPNPVRALLAAEAGDTLRLEHADGVLDAVTWQPRDGRESVRLAADGDGVSVAITLPSLAGEAAPAPLELAITRHLDAGWQWFEAEADAWDEALRRFFRATVGGRADDRDADVWAPAEAEVTVDAERTRGYAAVTGLAGARVSHNQAFSLVWEPLFELLSHPELGAGLLRLVHLDNTVERGAAWPPVAGETLTAEARLERLEDGDRGRTIRTVSRLVRDGEVCATVRSAFFVRGSHADTPVALREHTTWTAALELDAAALKHLAGREWIDASGLEPGEAALVVDLSEERPREGAAHFGAHGAIRQGDVEATITLDLEGDLAAHPVRAALEPLVVAEDAEQQTARKTLRREQEQAPRRMDDFAEVGGDLNPIHRSAAVARLAGLDRPIVHGMWTAARLYAAVVRAAGARGAERIADYGVEFLAPVEPGDAIELTVRRVAASHGRLVLEAVAERVTGDGRMPAVRARAVVDPPRTAYVLPGQGIQAQGMGMDAYSRSRAAKDVWDRADAYSRRELGFSILRVVRDNPRELMVDGQRQIHPKGVLHLTQFTQVAMAVLAQAQMAELREAGLAVEDAVTCGHSVGEYNALAAIAQVLPLEDVVDIVYRRGLAMHRLVARDARGESGYRMGVVRPHHAGMTHAEAEALVERVREETGGFVEIVNYNVKGRQYSVTGSIAALKTLERELMARQKPGGKPPWVEVPGIDVPFHSTKLRDGVPEFRKTLEAHLHAFDPAPLVGRYVPNLVPRPFSLKRAYIEEVQQYTGSDVLAEVLADWETWSADRPKLARRLLIELLAWQFASPVRWIETQDLLFTPVEAGGLGVERLVEVGVGSSPTLANMAKSTLARVPGHGVEILNLEADRKLLFALDEDEAAPEPVELAAEEAVEAAPVAEAAPAAPVAPAPPRTGGAPADAPYTTGDALTTLLALQARVRPEQLSPQETIDELFEGVSSRRNQVLMDLGAELDVGAIDGAHEKPLVELAGELAARAPRYSPPGPYLKGAQDEAIQRAFGRAGLHRAAIADHLTGVWMLGPGLQAAVFDAIALGARDGESRRGGELGAGEVPASKSAALQWIDAVVQATGAAKGASVAKADTGGGATAAVDAAVVGELEDRVLGADGVLMQAARDLAERLGHELEAAPAPVAGAGSDVLAAEMGEDFAALVAPRFEPLKHVGLTSAWAFARRDVAALYYDAVAGRVDDTEITREAERLAIHAADQAVADTARWYSRLAGEKGLGGLAEALQAIAAGGKAPIRVPRVRPALSLTDAGDWRYTEVEDAERALWAPDELDPILTAFDAEAADFRGRTALVTGASPSSIAIEAVGHLLRGGARVVVTTSSLSSARVDAYRAFYTRCAAPGAELHVVPFNQASRQDAEALAAWLFGEVTEQSGATTKVVKRPWTVDLLLPFGAMKDLATMDAIEGKSEAALRALLLGVERLITALAAEHRKLGVAGGDERGLHVVLPLSPNHGGFGGDGTYAEGKAALETLLAKWQSEHDRWGRFVSLVGARIGWVRGTGLMDANNLVAPGLEAATGVHTFTNAEMGRLIAALCTTEARRKAASAPWRVDLSGGFDALGDVKASVEAVRARLDAEATEAKRVRALQTSEARALGAVEAAIPSVKPLPHWPRQTADTWRPGAWPQVEADLSRTVVIVGLGELGPCGTARTRHELEVSERLSDAGVLELAWMTGLVQYEDDHRGGRWVDVDSGEPVAEADIAERYHDAVVERVGVRFVDPTVNGFDAEAVPVFTTAYLERDFTFPVGSEDEAHDFLRSDPEHTRVRFDDATGRWLVTRKAGSEVRVPRKTRLTRRVAGQLPSGFDLARFGVPGDMLDGVDPLSLMNLVATVDAFLSAGLTPEELLTHVHPARVANTQGAGMGGMRSLRRLYTDHLLGEPRQSDILQESLINVVAAYAVQSYVGSYGSMVHPVGACATAAVSLEEGYDKILAGRVDLVVAGAFDDLSNEGMLGFGDMNATADTDAMLARGIEPARMSRANDVRRRGFVEAQGGGTILLARGDVALELGLPVYGVLTWAGSYGDGIHKSIPAPGLGLMASAGPLGDALATWGLTADDIAVVYKHDTSTAANDPNENDLHDRIQRALGRTDGNPLFAVSQKTLTGHSKGGAAAWQLAGLCQSLAAGTIPGNRNLDAVDEAMRAFRHIGFSDRTFGPGDAETLRAGLVTSLGFGHVSAIALVAHRDAFVAAIPEDRREAYLAAANERLERQSRRVAEAMLGVRPLFERRTERRFEAPDGTLAQKHEEAAVLLDPAARLDPTTGRFVRPASEETA